MSRGRRCAVEAQEIMRKFSEQYIRNFSCSTKKEIRNSPYRWLGSCSILRAPTTSSIILLEAGVRVSSYFNEIVDRVSLDGDFLQESLAKTRQIDDFTSRLIEIHNKMMAINNEENIQFGLHRSAYMLHSETNSLLQIELNTILVSSPELGSLVSELYRCNATSIYLFNWPLRCPFCDLLGRGLTCKIELP